MAEHCGYIVEVKKLRSHTNADRLQVATFFGNDTIVGLDTHLGDIGIYFPSDLQLSEVFCQVNNLLRSKDPNVKGGYLDPDKRNVRVLKLRGEKSDGLYLPLQCLAEFTNIADLHPGDQITVLNGQEICRKYIPRNNSYSGVKKGKNPQKKPTFIAPTFYEHVDTEQLNYNLDAFRTGDLIELTLKCHGSSQRTGYLPIITTVKNGFFRRLFHLPERTRKEYGMVVGTRRVVLTGERKGGGFYESDEWRYAMTDKFAGMLKLGETVYYEVVGYQGPGGKPIMAACDNAKVKDKEFTKKYGSVTEFSYGCDRNGGYAAEECEDELGPYIKAPCCDIYVYRMTMVNEDGDVVEYPPWYMRRRCDQMGVKSVLLFDAFIIPDGVNPGEYVKERAEKYYDGPDPIGGTHIREGVVARIINRPTFTAYKTKNFYFKVLENIVKDEATAPDLEEAQEIQKPVTESVTDWEGVNCE